MKESETTWGIIGLFSAPSPAFFGGVGLAFPPNMVNSQKRDAFQSEHLRQDGSDASALAEEYKLATAAKVRGISSVRAGRFSLGELGPPPIFDTYTKNKVPISPKGNQDQGGRRLFVVTGGL